MSDQSHLVRFVSGLILLLSALFVCMVLAMFLIVIVGLIRQYGSTVILGPMAVFVISYSVGIGVEWFNAVKS